MSTSRSQVRFAASKGARFPRAGLPPTVPGDPTETAREARILLRAALDLLGKCDLQPMAERAVELATEHFSTAARLDLLDDAGKLRPVAASDPSGEMILLSSDFDEGHPAIQQLIAHGHTGLEAPEELRRTLWGQAAAKKEIVLSALTVNRRTRGILTFMSSPPTEGAGLESDHLLRYAFVSIVSRAVRRAEECEKRRRETRETSDRAGP